MARSKIYQRGLFIVALCGVSVVAWFIGRHAADLLENVVVARPEGLISIGGPVVEVRHDSRSQPLECDFQLYNPTSEPIIIRSVETGCSCRTASAESGTVGPGETFPLRIKVTAFPIDLAESRSTARVETSAPKPLILEIRVHLPLPKKTLFRPQILYLDPLPGKDEVARTVGIRVPKHCAKPLREADIIKVKCPEVDVKLTEMAPTDMYFEYQLKVKMKAGSKLQSDAGLRLDTGCNPVSISLRQSE